MNDAKRVGGASQQDGASDQREEKRKEDKEDARRGYFVQSNETNSQHVRSGLSIETRNEEREDKDKGRAPSHEMSVALKHDHPPRRSARFFFRQL